MSLPDISEWYVGQRAIHEEINWINNKPHEKYYLPFLLPRLGKYDVKNIIEFGCGTGHICKGLPEKMHYLGVDKNAWFIAKARDKFKDVRFRHFLKADVRDHNNNSYDLAMAWAFFKHFSLDEFQPIVGKVLSVASFGCFDVQIANSLHDDGVDYHHSFVTTGHLERVAALYNHEIAETQTLWEFEHPTLGSVKNQAYWTKRCQPT